MTDEQLQALLRSLPSVKAPTDLEKNLYISIAAGSNKVPHMLGTLPLVPAHEDFDTRLQQAIRERRHPVGPLPQAVSGGGVPWFASAGARWFTGAVVVVGLLFVTLNITQVDHQIQTPISPSAPAVVSGGQGSASNVASRLRESVVVLSQGGLTVEMPEPVVAELSGAVESQKQNVVTPSRPTSVEPVRGAADRATLHSQAPSVVSTPMHTPATSSANSASAQSGKKSLIDTPPSAHVQDSAGAAAVQETISKGKTDTLPAENGNVDTGGSDNSRTGPNM